MSTRVLIEELENMVVAGSGSTRQSDDNIVHCSEARERYLSIVCDFGRESMSAFPVS